MAHRSCVAGRGGARRRSRRRGEPPRDLRQDDSCGAFRAALRDARRADARRDRDGSSAAGCRKTAWDSLTLNVLEEKRREIDADTSLPLRSGLRYARRLTARRLRLVGPFLLDLFDLLNEIVGLLDQGRTLVGGLDGISLAAVQEVQ